MAIGANRIFAIVKKIRICFSPSLVISSCQNTIRVKSWGNYVFYTVHRIYCRRTKRVFTLN